MQGGFSIEAGRRCESGEGLFIFLSSHGPAICDTIMDNCSQKKKKSSSEQAGVQAEQSPSLVTRSLTAPSSFSRAEAPDNSKAAPEYATVSFVGRQPPAAKQEDHLCRSLGAVNLEGAEEGAVYHNWKKAKCPKPGLAGNSYGAQEWFSEEQDGGGGQTLSVKK